MPNLLQTIINYPVSGISSLQAIDPALFTDNVLISTLTPRAVYQYNASSTVDADGDLIVAPNNNEGRWYKIAEPITYTNQFGSATLATGTATVSNTTVTSSSLIFLTSQSNTATGVLYISEIVSGTSFTISSSIIGDTGLVGWILVNIS